MKKTLFVCAANVWRSQMAEAYFNDATESSDGISAALTEDRREKYNFKPAQEIIDVMKEDGIDISGQSIKLIDRKMCDVSDRIVLLLKTENEKSEFTIEGQDAVEFLLNNYKEKVITLMVEDPFWEGLEKRRKIRDQIKKDVHTLI